MTTYEDLKKEISESWKPYDTEKIDRAYRFALEAHGDQKRRSGEPYIIHPLGVAIILVQLGMDTESIIAALLHDVVEDTKVTSKEVEDLFGKEVALMVEGVTKLGQIPYSSREEQQAENVRKMLLAMAQDVRVIIIKLADRLHNMRTLNYMTEEKQLEKALETMEVYAPLAHRLGMKGIKEELEDLALKFLDPVAYAEIEKQLNLRKDQRLQFLEGIKKKISDRLDALKMHFTIEGRVKSIYGIYRKVYMQGRSFDEIYDIYAVRVIVDTVTECYNVLGIVHDMFRPIPNRFKDYISTPKQNMYQSLHTTVLDSIGKVPFEIQIRTWDMHYTAEYGIAAHWKYKIGLQGKDKMEERLAWVRQLLEAQQDSDDVEDLVRSIKTDIAPEEVFVFTPKGDVLRLPIGSTVIDFAYAIHSEVGNHMVGAKVDGRIVPLDTVVNTGNICEIMTSKAKDSGPSRDWLKIVKTTEARNKIRTWFKKERRDENVAEGRSELEREFRHNSITLSDDEMADFLQDVAKRQHYNATEDFLAAIGYGGISLSRIMPRIKEDYQKKYHPNAPEDILSNLSTAKPRSGKASGGVIVEGLEDCLVKFAKCCNPLPGDEIIGFVTRGYGVSVHKRDCPNILAAMENEEQKGRLVNTTWAQTAIRDIFKSTIEIYSEDRTGLIAEITTILSNMHISISGLLAREMKDHFISIQIMVEINDLNQLENIMNNIRKVRGVRTVQRAKN